MKKTIASSLVIGLFLALCLFPGLGIFLLGESQPAANEQLAPRPRWGLSVLNESADWLADHFALRQDLVTLWARLNAAVGTSTEEQVLLGREGWLYYAPTLPDYSGEHLSDEELERIALRLASLQADAEQAGMRFVFTVAPNKNTLYPDAMPSWAKAEHGNGNLSRLQPRLEAHGIRYVDLSGIPMPYYRTDSHWTAEGAAMAADALLAALDRQSSYAAGPFREEGLHRGDLYEMLYPAARGAEPEIVYAELLQYESLNDTRGGNAITIRTASSEGTGRLYCWRDSFGIALYPYLADSFAEAVFSRSRNYQIPDGEYDVLILEIVERNLPELLAE